MKSLLAIEWLKIKSYRTFWVLIGLFTTLFVFWTYLISQSIFHVGPVNVLGDTDSFGEIWDSVTAHASNFVIFLAILLAILVTNEYNYKTQRQNMIDGWSRLQAYHSKWILLLVLATFTTAFVFLTGLVMGLLKGARWDGFSEHIIRVLWMFILSANYFGFGMLMGHLVKRSGLAISLLVIYSMMFEFLIHLYSLFKQKFFIDLLLPLQSSDELLQLSSIENVRKMGGAVNNISVYAYAAASIGWIFIYYIVGRLRLQKSDW